MIINRRKKLLTLIAKTNLKLFIIMYIFFLILTFVSIKNIIKFLIRLENNFTQFLIFVYFVNTSKILI